MYKQKYLKYKQKYLELKKMKGGTLNKLLTKDSISISTIINNLSEKEIQDLINETGKNIHFVIKLKKTYTFPPSKLFQLLTK